jgi:hypothetical protein
MNERLIAVHYIAIHNDIERSHIVACITDTNQRYFYLTKDTKLMVYGVEKDLIRLVEWFLYVIKPIAEIKTKGRYLTSLNFRQIETI